MTLKHIKKNIFNKKMYKSWFASSVNCIAAAEFRNFLLLFKFNLKKEKQNKNKKNKVSHFLLFYADIQKKIIKVIN